MKEGKIKSIKIFYAIFVLLLLIISFLPWDFNSFNFTNNGFIKVLYGSGFLIVGGIPALIISLILLNTKKFKTSLILGTIGIGTFSVAATAFIVIFINSPYYFISYSLNSAPGVFFYLTFWMFSLVSIMNLIRYYRKFLSIKARQKFEDERIKKVIKISKYLENIQKIYKRINFNDILLNLDLTLNDLFLVRTITEELIQEGKLGAKIDGNYLIIENDMNILAIN